MKGETKETPIFLLHGLGSHTLTLLPLELYLNYVGWKNTYRIYYPVDKLSFDETMNYVDRAIETIVKYRDREIIVIGQSMGGVVANNLHSKGWLMKNAVYIGSPLHGANLLNQLEAVLPTFIRDIFHKLPYDYLKNKESEKIPPHPYKTVSMGWACSDFDGCVYRKEAMLEEEHHTHLSWADHRTIFANPRLFVLIDRLIRSN